MSASSARQFESTIRAGVDGLVSACSHLYPFHLDLPVKYGNVIISLGHTRIARYYRSDHLQIRRFRDKRSKLVNLVEAYSSLWKAANFNIQYSVAEARPDPDASGPGRQCAA